MGSYCRISFDQLGVFESKSYVPDDWAALFQESDRREEMRRDEGADEEDEFELYVEYVADRSTVLQRLALLGITQAASEEAFRTWHQNEQETWTEYAETWGEESGAHARKVADALASLDWPTWQGYAQACLATRFRPEADTDEGNPLTRQFHDLNDSYLYVDGYGSLLSLRVLLEAFQQIEVVKLDVSDLLHGGYYEEDARIIADARKKAPQQLQPLSPTVILAEGSSDIAVLRLALAAMYPDVNDYFSFFNHSELSVDGGANYLVKFLKAFAAARAPSRMLAIFDNDAAGTQAFEQARRLSLTPNIIVTKLPDSQIARDYPTNGPGGAVRIDVNGQAAGIELYLGRDALMSENHELRPVRWGGYVPAVERYQGEVEGKNAVIEAFTRQISSLNNPAHARDKFPDLAAVWQHIFDLVEYQAGESFSRNHERSPEDL